MTNEELFYALSQVKPEYLEHRERMPVSPKRTPVRRMVLIAAVVAALTCTVFAAPYIRDFLKGMYQRTYLSSGAVTDIRGQTHVNTGMLDVYVELALEENRPRQIEQAYVPMYFAENWEPVAVQAPDYQAEWTTNVSTLLAWYTEDGKSACFEQHIVDSSIPANCTEFEIDSVNTGYNERVETEQVIIGEYKLYRVAVPPSSIEVDGETYTDEGRRRYYWSDGLYYYILELNWATEESVVELALDSLTPVENIAEYEKVEYYESDSVIQSEPCDIMLYPTWLPEGWRRYWAGYDVDGYYGISWDYQAETGEMTSDLTLEQGGSGLAGWIHMWENGPWEGTKEVLTIGAWEVTIYYNDERIQVLWYDGELDYLLKTAGPDRMSMEDILRVMESLETIENPETFLQSTAPEQTLFPEWVPEGWDKLRAEVLDGYYTFTWRHQVTGEPVYSNLTLEQMEHGSQMSSWMRSWLGPIDRSSEYLTIGQWDVTIYYNDTRIDAFWSADDVDYVLHTDGENMVCLEEVIRILESLSQTEEPEALAAEFPFSMNYDETE